jgi:hypothetical protein
MGLHSRQASVRGGAPLASPGPASAAGGHSRQESIESLESARTYDSAVVRVSNFFSGT